MGAAFVSGNCERDVLNPDSDVDRWCNERLGERERESIAAWPLDVEREIDGLGTVVFCHATPRDDETILTRITPDADVVAAARAASTRPSSSCGHTHVQFDRRVPGAPRLVNAGSVGLAVRGRAGRVLGAARAEASSCGGRSTTSSAPLAELRATGFPRFDEIFAGSLEGRVTAVEATTEFESRRGA